MKKTIILILIFLSLSSFSCDKQTTPSINPTNISINNITLIKDSTPIIITKKDTIDTTLTSSPVTITNKLKEDDLPSYMILTSNEKIRIYKYNQLYNFYLKTLKKPSYWNNYKVYSDSIFKSNPILNNKDSITIKTINDFIILNKYDRLYKYYKICKNKPSQYKYYKGWSIRVFSQK